MVAAAPAAGDTREAGGEMEPRPRARVISRDEEMVQSDGDNGMM